MCVLSDQVIPFWTSPRLPGVSCEDKYFFTTGRWGTSPCRAPSLPCEQAQSRHWKRASTSNQLHHLLFDWPETGCFNVRVPGRQKQRCVLPNKYQPYNSANNCRSLQLTSLENFAMLVVSLLILLVGAGISVCDFYSFALNFHSLTYI